VQNLRLGGGDLGTRGESLYEGGGGGRKGGDSRYDGRGEGWMKKLQRKREGSVGTVGRGGETGDGQTRDEYERE